MIPPSEKADLPVTEWAVSSLTPTEWVHIADFLTGLLQREPLRHGPGWNAERLVLGSLALELRGNAIATGEPAEPLEEGTVEKVWGITSESFLTAL